MLRGTPFHERTSALCLGHNWRRWAGYIVAGSYDYQHEREYHAIRNSAALIDVSPLYKYRITGPDAERLLNRIITRDVRKQRIGQVYYTPWCNDTGKVLDDGTVQRLGEDDFRLTAADPNFRYLAKNSFSLDVSLADESESLAALALQGPNARVILQNLGAEGLEGLRYFWVTDTHLGGIPVTMSRTGYTGDLGYEIWMNAEHAIPVWDALTEVGADYGITPAGILALDVARVEAGLILIEIDYTSARHAHIEAQTSTPLELGLGWTVKLDKPYFVGQDALAAEAARGPQWRLMGLRVHWESLEDVYGSVGLPVQVPTTTWRTSIPLYVNGRQIGYASSGTWSPVLKEYIALAHLMSPWAEEGTEVWFEVTVEHQRKEALATAVRTPFYDPARKRALPESVPV